MADRTDLRHLHAMLKMASEIDPFMTVTRLECFLAFASNQTHPCLLYTSPSPRDGLLSRMPSSA